MNLTKGKRMMDELDLIQEAVSNWESLYEIEEVETCEILPGALEERSFLSRILLREREEPIYIEMRVLKESEGRLKEIFERERPVIWSKPGYSLN